MVLVVLLIHNVGLIVPKQYAKSIYQKYLKLPKIQRLLENNEFLGVFGDMDGNVDWSNSESYNYIMVVKDLVLCLSDEQIKQFSSIEDDNQLVNWNNLFIFNSEGVNQPTAKYNLSNIFTNYFVIFADNFILQNPQAIRHKFIQSLSLGRHENLFIEAQNFGESENKLVNGGTGNNDELDNDYALQQILIKNINIQNNDVIGITDNHLNNIKTIFNLNNKPPKEVAMHLLCLSYLFVKYSSQSIFGTEDSSPHSLRILGYAYMQEAYYNDKTLFNRVLANGEVLYEYENWKNQLLPKNSGIYGCTDMLSLTMIMRIKANFPRKILRTLIPPAWL